MLDTHDHNPHTRYVWDRSQVPWLYKSMLEANKELFKGPLMTTVTLYTARGEGDLAAALTVRCPT